MVWFFQQLAEMLYEHPTDTVYLLQVVRENLLIYDGSTVHVLAVIAWSDREPLTLELTVMGRPNTITNYSLKQFTLTDVVHQVFIQLGME